MSRFRRSSDEVPEGGARQVSAPRKGLYYAGLAISILGAVLFLGGFLFGMTGMFEDRVDFGATRDSMKTTMFLSFGGVVLVITGQALRRVGARGLAGSGLVLDPERARRDLEPWSRMAGGVAEDALGEVDTVQKIANRGAEPPTVRVRCRGCKALNDETAKFCDQCGAAL